MMPALYALPIDCQPTISLYATHCNRLTNQYFTN